MREASSQLHQVFLHRRRHVHVQDLTLCIEDLLLGDDGSVFGTGRRGLPCAASRQGQDTFFGIDFRVANAYMHQKAVELCFRERVGAFVFNRVLRGHHQEQPGQTVRGLSDGDLALAHGFQQR